MIPTSSRGQAKARFFVMLQSTGVLGDMRAQEGMQQAPDGWMDGWMDG
mgnify:CR=1 FL=1|jgi:hypothetical protein